VSVSCIRRVARILVTGTLVGFFALIIFGLVRHQPLHHHDLWGALGCTIFAVGFWGLFELLPKLTDEAVARIVGAQPDARTLVARTVEVMEEERERQAAEGLPRIVGGERWR
jgi:hypothetical protein